MTWLPSNMPVEVYDFFSTAQVLFYFVAIPLLFVLLVVVLVSAPGWTRSGRHRPGQGWSSDPLMVGAGEQTPPALGTGEGTADGTDSGGSSSRW